jgi:ubiquinone/menaquinone biosynthesis C-methylase UbiE
MSYRLEAKSEFDRLEEQATIDAYDHKKELARFDAKPGMRILDAGCGSGVVSRHLAERFPECKIVGCDFSETRVEQASNAAQGIKNLSFETGDLQDLPYDDGSFDRVVSRFVFEHQTVESLKKVTAEVARVLKPDGEAWIIDVDGLMLNIYPQSPSLAQALKNFEKTGQIDLYIGRKLPHVLAGAGLNVVQWKVDTFEFSGKRLEKEKEMMRQRFENGGTFFESVCGGNQAAKKFYDEYLSTMDRADCVSFFSKFVVQARKPENGRPLSLVRSERN